MASLKEIVRDNVLALILERTGPLTGKETGITRLRKMGVIQGNAQRALEGTTSVGLDVLQEIADALEVQPWQLLIEGLEPKELPGLTADPTAWPFPMVNREAYRDLPAADRAYAQGRMDQAIADRKAARAKPTGKQKAA